MVLSQAFCPLLLSLVHLLPHCCFVLLLLFGELVMQVLQLCLQACNLLLMAVPCGRQCCLAGCHLLLQLPCSALSLRTALLQQLHLSCRRVPLLTLQALGVL